MTLKERIEGRGVQIMSIINITPDSFFASSRVKGEAEIVERVARHVAEGCDILDVGAYSSRPGAAAVSLEEELARLLPALKAIRANFPGVCISIDTFRSEVARRAIEEFDVEIINDISGGAADEKMFKTVAQSGKSYILMHMKGEPQTMQSQTDYGDFWGEIFDYFKEKLALARAEGLTDISLDPGFGFAKNLEQNFFLMKNLEKFKEFSLPILVGISRKSMIYKTLNSSPEDALNGTSALNTIALMNGAEILRVHDTKAAKEALTIFEKYKNASV